MKNETRVWLILFVVAGAYLVWRTAAIGMGSQYIREVNGHPTPAGVADTVAGTAQFSVSRTLGTWFAAFLTLAIFSFLYRDNPFYKFAESVFIGVSAAYWMVVAFWDVLVPNLFHKVWPALIQAWALPGLPPERDQWWWVSLIPLMLGGMLLLRLSPRGGWIAVWPLAFVIGTFAGLRLVGFIQADFMNQIRGGIQPIAVMHANALTHSKSFDWQHSIENFLLLAGTLVCLAYFFFSAEHKGAFGRLSKAGIWVLMITFGAGFGYTVMGRIALLAGRLEFLFDNWIWINRSIY